MAKSPRLQFIRLSIIIILIALLVWIISGFSSLYWESKESFSWPNTIGEIIDWRIGTSCYEFGSCSEYPDVSYNYIVNGNSYYSDRIEVFNWPAIVEISSLDIKTYLKSIKRNKNQITVYYNPKNPNQAVLLPGQKFMRIHLILRIFGIVIICFFLYFFIRAVINPLTKQPPLSGPEKALQEISVFEAYDNKKLALIKTKYALKRYPNDPKLLEKLKELEKKGGKGLSNKEITYLLIILLMLIILVEWAIS